MRAALPAALTLSALSLFWGLQGMPRHWPEAEPQAALPQLQQPVRELLRAPRTQPMYLLLTVEGLAYCAEGEGAPEVVDNATLERYCARHGLDNAQRLGELLERIEPGGAAGKIQVGYVITTKLLSQFQRAADGQWQFDPAPLARELRLVEKLDRPVALYLSSTHFDTLGPLPAELAKDAANLALFADRQPRTLDYFSYPIVPYTLDANPELAVNRYKRQALQQVHAMLAAMAPQHRQKIVAIFLGGETHHFYQNFADGMGEFERPVVTDHGPASVQAFRRWLQQRYGSIEALNAAYLGEQAQAGSAAPGYTDFDQIEPPAGNFRDDPQTPYLQHYDGHSHGQLAVHGWYWDAQHNTQALRVYLDGQLIGPAQQGLNRLDVYRQLDEVGTPASGFRLELPFDALPAGRHMVSVSAVRGQRECLLDERVVNILGRDGARFDWRDQHRVFTSLQDKLPRCVDQGRESQALRFHLDAPGWDLPLGYNPLARDWNEFRQAQVLRYMQALFDWAVQIGFAPELLFSHQILPQLNSSWNANLFATQRSVAPGLPWKPGFNLYGGGVWSAPTQALIGQLQAGPSGYGVPEFHPQQWKDRRAVAQALAGHYNAGAHFISPYYFSIAPEKHLQAPESNAVSRMRLEPGNSADGSDLFYEALLQFAAQ